MLKTRVLEPPNTHYLSAAEGWMDLGDFNEALAELGHISVEYQSHFEVMQMRWHIHNKRREWSDCLHIGLKMIKTNPDLPQGWINHGNALFYLSRYEEAFNLLRPTLEKFPQDEAIPYNLACYKCQAGDLLEAKAWLERAYTLGDENRIRKMALNDPDLKQLWKSSGML